MPGRFALIDLAPWTDRAGRLSWLKLACFIGALLPACWLAYAYATDNLGTKPLTALNHETGLWATRFLAVTLAITPFRRIFAWPRLIVLRRQLGLTVLAYSLIHVVIYVIDQSLDLVFVLSEIVHRFYLGLGTIALVIFLVQGATSNDGALKRLGAVRWNEIHRLIYPAILIVLLHFLLQSKLDVSEACLMLGLFAALMLYRLAHDIGLPLKFPTLLGVAVLSGVLTMLAEAGWYASGGRISFWLVLESNLDPLSTFRPGWWTFASAALVAVLAFARACFAEPERPARRHAPHRA